MPEDVGIEVKVIGGPNNVKLVLDPKNYECPAMVYAGLGGKVYSSYKNTIYYGRVGEREEIVGLTSGQMRSLELLGIEVKKTTTLAAKLHDKGLSY